MSWLDRLKALSAEGSGLPAHRQNRQNPGFVSFGSTEEAASLPSEGSDDAREAEEERAAIMEYDGGLSRAEAEWLAGLSDNVTRARAREGDGKCSAALHSAGSNATGDDAPPVVKPRWPLEAWGDMRPCTRCRNLARSGRCVAAFRGELRAARDYEPSIPTQPRRCIGYSPPPDDPDQSPGRERWPELVEWQARID